MKAFFRMLEAVGWKYYYRLQECIKPTAEVRSNQINLIWWNKKTNLGDYLSTVVYDWIVSFYRLDKNKKTKNTRCIMGIGSIIMLGVDDAAIWGSGILSAAQIPFLHRKSRFRKFDIRAVRGPLTRNVLQSMGYQCPEVYGDPAILMPLIYQPSSLEKKYSISIIEHYAKREVQKKTDVHYINIETTDYKAFINQIKQSEKIISSSLHGVILAEAYGVPAVFWNKNMDSQLLKFWDWYISTGRTDIRYADNLDDALKMEPMPLPNLELLQQQLIDVFPKDLWEN